MILAWAVVGYLIGSLPTAEWIARSSGLDLRREGSRNPGANNARALGGIRLAATVLVVEMSKGAGAVALAGSAGGSTEAALAGIGALAGNVYNVWYRFEGGQGLGITGGILVAAWPVWFPVVLAVVAAITVATRRTAKAALAALGVILLGGALEAQQVGLPTVWGIGRPGIPILAIGLTALIAPRQIDKLRSHDPSPPGLEDERHGPVVR